MSANLSVILPLLIIQVILMVIALIDLAKSEKTNGPKFLWVLIILFASLLGSVAYFIFGRRNN
jgi:hypothetical protein